MKWLAQSLDLNPVENKWGYLNEAPHKQVMRPRTCNQLFSVLQSNWDALLDGYFSTLVDSIPTRATAVMRARWFYQVLNAS